MKKLILIAFAALVAGCAMGAPDGTGYVLGPGKVDMSTPVIVVCPSPPDMGEVRD